MRVVARRVLLSACAVVVAIAPVALYTVHSTDEHVAPPEARLAAQLPAAPASQRALVQQYVDEGLEPDVAALRAQLEALDAPESGACVLARESARAESDAEFARDVEKICVAWRKLMWDYATAHAAEVETGDPVAIERTRTAFAMMDVALMRELMRAGGGDETTEPVPADPVDAVQLVEPELGPEAKEEP